MELINSFLAIKVTLKIWHYPAKAEFSSLLLVVKVLMHAFTDARGDAILQIKLTITIFSWEVIITGRVIWVNLVAPDREKCYLHP